MAIINRGTNFDRLWEVSQEPDGCCILSCVWYEDRDDLEVRCEATAHAVNPAEAEAAGKLFVVPEEGTLPHIQFMNLVEDL